MSFWDYYSFIAEGDSSPTFCYRIKYNGNTIAVQFGPVKKYSGRLVYSVCLSIFRKRKREDIEFHARAVTGTIGVSGLLLAKESFDLFIKDFFNELDFDSVILSVQGADARRYKIYKRTLKRMGYTESRLLGPLCMSKVYHREV
jgi:hypothetical protein